MDRSIPDSTQSERLSDQSFSTAIGGPFSAEEQRKDEVAEPHSSGFLTILGVSSVALRREIGGHDHKLRFFGQPLRHAKSWDRI